MRISNHLLQELFPFLDESNLIVLERISKELTFQNKETIRALDQRADYIYFITSGMMRGYIIDNKGDEKNIMLRPAHTFCIAPEVLQGATKSRYIFESIGDTTIIRYPYTDFEALAQTQLPIAQLYIRGLKEGIATFFFRLENLSTKTPEERYDEMLERFPQFLEKAYNKHIANFLGITPNSLSRIIKRKKKG